MSQPDDAPLLIDRVEVEDSTQVSAARDLAVSSARELSAESAIVDRIALVATELAQNLHRHAVGGEFIVTMSATDNRLTMLALDRGPGVAQFDRCMVDGYSTGGTMGTGLGAVQRIAGEFDAVSEVDRGTVVSAAFAIQREVSTRPTQFDVGAVGFPIPGEVVNGDTHAVRLRGPRLVVCLADGLGHGQYAADASRAAVEQLLVRGDDGPEALVRHINDELAKTRGAAVTVADLEIDVARHGGEMRSSGLGNVSLLVAGADGSTKRIVTSHGTAGARQKIRMGEQVSEFPALGTLVLHTDGLITRWDLERRSELLRHSSLVVAATLWRDFGRGTDDSLVVVVKARGAASGGGGTA